MVVLRKNLDRARAFSKIFAAASTNTDSGGKRGRGRPNRNEHELPRATVVFAIGALDAYLSEVTAEVLVAQLGDSQTTPTASARRALSTISKEISSLALELALIVDASVRHEVARRAIVGHMTSNVSNHGAKAVGSTIDRMGEISPGVVWGAVQSRMTDFPRLAQSGGSPPAILDHWTNVRHRIVHQGEAVTVSVQLARELVDFIEAIGEAVDSVARGCMPPSAVQP